MTDISHAQAQDVVSTRIYVEQEKTRLVFDLPAAANYESTKDNGTLRLKFSKNAKFVGPNAALGAINSISETSQNPLGVTLNFSPTNRIRHFQTGQRVIVDVFGKPTTNNTPGPQEKNIKEESPSPAPQIKPEEKKAPAVKAEIEEKPYPVSESTPTLNKEEIKDTTEAETVKAIEDKIPEPPQEDLKEDHNKDGDHNTKEEEESPQKDDPPPLKTQASDTRPPPTQLELLKENTDISASTLTFSAIESSGLAVFPRDGSLWIINDRDDLQITPQASGANANLFEPIENFKIQDGQGFQIPIQNKKPIRGEGGGLIWRLVLTNSNKVNPPIEPVVQHAPSSKIHEDGRGGSLIFPFRNAKKVLKMNDPQSGQELYVVTVDKGTQGSDQSYSFIDFDTLPSPVGLVVLPKVDDLDITIQEDGGVKITRPNGLALSQQSDKTAAKSFSINKKRKLDAKQNDTKGKKIFSFQDWSMGGEENLPENQTLVLSNLKNLELNEQVEGILGLAKMYLSNGHAIEALGYLELAENFFPELSNSPEFIALSGAAHALSWKSEPAFEILSNPDLEPYDEVGYWRAYALADLGDWQQAADLLPENFNTLYTYPDVLLNRLGLVLGEVVLRTGNVEEAESLLNALQINEDKMLSPLTAGYTYLRGEIARQKGDWETTKTLWTPLITGTDDLYRAKTLLAITRLQVDDGDIKPNEAIDNLERLRYAWRGDELETQIHYWLGRTYFESGQYAKGLNIMREAASYAVVEGLAERITSEMSRKYVNLFTTDTINEISPMDAVALYEQFGELVPVGEDGNGIVEALADRLASADLLDRASKLLRVQVELRLPPDQVHRVGVKLAALDLINKKPDEALKAIQKAKNSYQQLPDELKTQTKDYELSLLEARAYLQQDRPDKALAVLNELERTAPVNSLKADIAWRAEYWDDAAEAIGDVILDRNIASKKTLSDEDVDILLQHAVSLNLAGDRIGLANMREKYGQIMSRTKKAEVFEVITRPRRSSALADRNTLMGVVSEVDLFGKFLDKYKGSNPDLTKANSISSQEVTE